MRRLFFAALIFLALGPVPGTVHRFPVDNLTQRAAARPLAFAPQTSGTMRFVRGWNLVSPHSRFGGLSAIARIAPDRFLLIGDNGYATRLAFDRGRLAAFHIAPLPVPPGWPDRKAMLDTESLVVDRAHGTAWVGLERINELWRFDSDLTRLQGRHAPAAMRGWPRGRGAEALAGLADGRILILAEGGRDDPRRNRGLLLAGYPDAPSPPPTRFFYDSQGKGAVSDAAPLPDGRVLIIHRKVGWSSQLFTTTVAIADPHDIAPGAILRSRTIGVVPGSLADNYEGAAVSVEQGRTWLWLVADDNFQNWQRSLLLQFELVDLPPKRAPDSKKAARKPAA